MKLLLNKAPKNPPAPPPPPPPSFFFPPPPLLTLANGYLVEIPTYLLPLLYYYYYYYYYYYCTARLAIFEITATITAITSTSPSWKVGYGSLRAIVTSR